MRPLIIFVFISSLMTSVAYAEETDQHNQPASGVTSLSSGLRDLLSREMQAIEKGMMAIIPAYASGNWSEIARIAGQIENSFILKQLLSDKQVHELHAALPHEFIKLDQQFHYLAGMLAHAAKLQKQELVGFYFSELNNACVGCHSQFALHKFPAFDSARQQNEHSH